MNFPKYLKEIFQAISCDEECLYEMFTFEEIFYLLGGVELVELVELEQESVILALNNISKHIGIKTNSIFIMGL